MCDLMKSTFYLLLISLLFSCKALAPNRILVSKEPLPLATDSLTAVGVYTIEPFDKLDLKIFSNDGFKLVDITSYSYTTGIADKVDYIVNEAGEVKLPVIGYVNLKGLSIEQAERALEKKYERYFNQPFVNLKVTNRHVIVFMGDGKGQVIPLLNENTTLFDVLAAAGGITDFAKAYKIQIIRGSNKNPQIFIADVSKIEGLKYGNIRMLSNDIVHVEAVPNYSGRIYQRFFPIIGLLTSALLILNFVKK